MQNFAGFDRKIFTSSHKMRENLKSPRETVLGEIKEELRFYQLRLSELVTIRWPIRLQYVANNDWIEYNGVAFSIELLE